MALASLFPKGFFDKKPESPSISSSSSASSSSSTLSSPVPESEEILPGRDKDGKFKLPPVAIYVSGAAFALTIGLTILVVPYVRMAGRTTKTPPTFLSHSNTSVTLRPGRIKPIPALSADTKPIGSTLLSKTTTIPDSKISPDPKAKQDEPSSALTKSSIAAMEVPDERAETSLLTMRRFNTAEERTLYGTSEADDKDDTAKTEVNPLIGFYALGIATGIVGLSAGAGIWITAKLMGVKSMDELASRMREGLVKNMPVLAQTMDQAKEHERQELGEGQHDSVWDQWTRSILGEGEEEKRQV